MKCLQAIKDLEVFFYKNIRETGAEIKGLVRNETYELPTEAIREAIVNVTTYRNFLDRACVQVTVSMICISCLRRMKRRHFWRLQELAEKVSAIIRNGRYEI